MTTDYTAKARELLNKWLGTHVDAAKLAAALREADEAGAARGAAAEREACAKIADEMLLLSHTAREIDDQVLPFCACGRRWSECDGSRQACRKRGKR